MAILRQNADDNKDDQKDPKKATAAKDKKGGTYNDSASRKLGRAQNLTASGDDDEYDWTKPHTGDTKFLGGTVAKVTKDGDVVMSDHLAEGEMLRSAHDEEHKRYEGRSADL